VGLAAAGRTDEAIRRLRQAHRVDADSLRVLNGLAWVLATHPDATSGDGAEAVLLAKKVAQKTEYKNPQVLDTLAAAQAAAGNFDHATSTIKRAIELATGTGSSKLAAELGGRLQLYQQRLPYRETAASH
jgi:tetratricopeptide (TPR) repeat protein